MPRTILPTWILGRFRRCGRRTSIATEASWTRPLFARDASLFRLTKKYYGHLARYGVCYSQPKCHSAVNLRYPGERSKVSVQQQSPTQVSRARRPLHHAYSIFIVLLGGALWAVVFTGVIQAAPVTQQYAIGWFFSDGQQGTLLQSLANDSPTQGSTNPDANALERQLFSAVNQARAAKGLPALRTNPALARAARGHSQDMAQTFKFASVDGRGATPPQRASAAGYAQSQTLSELISAGYVKPAQVVAALTANPDAAKILFSADTTELGVGYAYASRDPIYHHYWTIDLGGRAGSVTLPTATATPTSTRTPTTVLPTTAPATLTPTPIASPTAPAKPATGITLRSVSTANNASGASSLTINAPAGIASGDVLIAHLVVRGAYTAMTAPPGWSLIRRDTTTNSIAVGLYSKVVSNSEPAGFTWTFNSSQQAAGGMAAYAGVDNAAPIDASSAQYNDSTAPITVPSVTASAPSARLVFFAAITTGTTVTPPSGMARQWTASTAGTTSAMADQALPSAGTTGNRIGTSGAPYNSNIGQLVALRAALAGTLPPTPTKIALPTPTAVASPPAQGASIYWGAYILGNSVESPHAPPKDTGTIDQFEARTGKKMSILEWGLRWQKYGAYQNFDATLMETVRQRGMLSLFDWDSQDYTFTGHRYDQPALALGTIINGTHDAYIRQWATDAKNWGYPFFLRFDAEMNGDWEAWSELRNGNKPGQYVQAWRHIHDIFTQVGATNVSWVWCPNTEKSTTIPLEQLYPGDAYVDWTCIDGYNWGEHPAHPYGWWKFYDIFKPTYDHILKIAPTKPMMIGETSSSEYGGSKAAWITDVLTVQLPKNFPNIKAFIWFNVNDYDVDWAIETSSAAQAAFAAGIASPYYAANDFATLRTSPIPPPR